MGLVSNKLCSPMIITEGFAKVDHKKLYQPIIVFIPFHVQSKIGNKWMRLLEQVSSVSVAQHVLQFYVSHKMNGHFFHRNKEVVGL